MEANMYQMISKPAVAWFQKEREAGRMPRQLPEGAFDVMTPRLRRRLAQDVKSIGTDPIKVADHLSGAMRKSLDQMSPETKSAIMQHLGKDQGPLLPAEVAALGSLATGGGEIGEAIGGATAAGTGLQAVQGASQKQDDDGDSAFDQDPDQIEQICALLEQAGVPEEVIEQVRERLEGNGEGETESDGNLAILHKGDQRPFTTKKAYDSPIQGGPSGQYDPGGRAARLSTDEPPAFRGAPRVGGSQVPLSVSADTNRRMAMDSIRRVKVLDNVGCTYRVKDAPRPRKPNTMAFDSASLRSFIRRFPDAARLMR
jgi:hypothetical protein